MLDDIYSYTFEEHLRRVEQVLERVEEHGLKLKPHKCHLFQENISYLGHSCSREDVQPLEAKVRAVQEWATPHTVQEFQAFLRLVRY